MHVCFASIWWVKHFSTHFDSLFWFCTVSHCSGFEEGSVFKHKCWNLHILYFPIQSQVPLIQWLSFVAVYQSAVFDHWFVHKSGCKCLFFFIWPFGLFYSQLWSMSFAYGLWWTTIVTFHVMYFIWSLVESSLICNQNTSFYFSYWCPPPPKKKINIEKKREGQLNHSNTY